MNYEEKYKQALERAKEELRVCGSQDCDAARQIFRFFPELKGNEDERIRKAIYNALKYLETELSWDFVDEVDILDVYAWLEKQKPNTHKKEIDDTVEKTYCYQNYLDINHFD